MQKEEVTESYKPSKKEIEEITFLDTRVQDLKEFRKKKLIGLDRSIEEVWKDADNEYQPHELSFNRGDRKRIETDDELGLRGRLVKVGSDSEWQSNEASPSFYVKVNTALSILVDQNPEAVFIPSGSKYEANTKLAYANWKNSWEVSGAKQQIKNFIFNLAKYGTGFGRTYPKIIKMEKKVLKEYYEDTPEKNKTEKKTITKFNDLCREALNPWQVWISEMARPGDYFSMDDWYYEKDYSWDSFQQQFDKYANSKAVKKGAHETDEESQEKNKDTVTVGFYENQVTDKFVIWVPSQKIILYSSPLPNDDGMLSLWFAPWSMRDDRILYGIGLYEILKQDTILYDKLFNMTMDQLVLSIYKMFFYSGTNSLGENGRMVISPGAGEQVIDPKSITFLDVPPPGQEAWKGLQFIQDRQDTNSGVPQQLSGKFSGKTLGQDMEAKATALERMKTPLDYICDALQQEAYISISWQKQILSIPEILEYQTMEDLGAALKEMGLQDKQIQTYLQDEASQNPNTELLEQEASEEMTTDEFGNETQVPPKKFANVYPEASMNLEKDESGELIESEKNRFYRFGVDLPIKSLDWKGVVRIKPQSVLAPSKELEKRLKLDLFNLVYPAIQAMLGAPMSIPILMKPIKQILKAYDEDSKEWFDEEALAQMQQAAAQPKESAPEVRTSLSVSFNDLSEQNKDGIPLPLTQTQKQIVEKYLGIKVEEPLFVDAEQGMQQGQQQMGQEQPQEESLFVDADPSKGAEQIEPLAELGEAPQSLGGAVAGNYA
jgi:hypothetical protein